MFRQSARPWTLAILFVIAGFISPVFADSGVLVLYRSDIPLYREIAQLLEAHSPSKFTPCPLESLTASLLETLYPPIVIALGDAGLKRALKTTWNVPIIATLVESVPDDPRVRHLSTSQPLERQIELLRRLVPDLQRIWIPQIACSFSNEAIRSPLPTFPALVIDNRPLGAPRDLPVALRALEPKTTALILSLDPCLTNDAAQQTLLLGSFEKQCPVVGFSEALVRKGAVFALTLSPEGLADDLTRFTREVLEKPTMKQRAFTGWRMVINQTILGKLGIDIPSDLLGAADKVY